MLSTRHAADGSDDAGRGLTLTIRLAPDGRVYLADIPPDLLPIALALAPHDESLLARAALAAGYLQEDCP
jgi:hypothetical protein